MWNRTFIYLFSFFYFIGVSAYAQSKRPLWKRDYGPALFITTGGGYENSRPEYFFARTHRFDMVPIGIGIQAKSWLRVYLTLEYNSFQYRMDLDDYRTHYGPKPHQYSLSEGVLLFEHEKNKRQEVIFPSLTLEKARPLNQYLNLAVAWKIGLFRSRNAYTYENAWGYGGNGKNIFRHIESNKIASSERAYFGLKSSLSLVLEWKIGNARVGIVQGIQLTKISDGQLDGTTYLHTNGWYRSASGIHSLKTRELAYLSALRVCYTLKKR